MAIDQPRVGFDRDAILNLLRVDPILCPMTRAPATWLRMGEEYVDLQRLKSGVQRAKVKMMLTGGELSSKNVTHATWERLLAFLGPRQGVLEAGGANESGGVYVASPIAGGQAPRSFADEKQRG